MLVTGWDLILWKVSKLSYNYTLESPPPHTHTQKSNKIFSDTFWNLWCVVLSSVLPHFQQWAVHILFSEFPNWTCASSRGTQSHHWLHVTREQALCITSCFCFFVLLSYALESLSLITMTWMRRADYSTKEPIDIKLSPRPIRCNLLLSTQRSSHESDAAAPEGLSPAQAGERSCTWSFSKHTFASSFFFCFVLFKQTEYSGDTKQLKSSEVWIRCPLPPSH